MNGQRRKRNVALNLMLTAEEKRSLVNAAEKTGCKNMTDYIVKVAKNTHCIVVSEVRDYDFIYSKIGNLSNQIAAALNTIVDDERKYQNIINYFERDEQKVLKAITAYSANLQELLAAYLDYETQIEIKTNIAVKEYKKKAGF